MKNETSKPIQAKAKPTKQDIDAAFDSLVTFLFDRYRHYKEVQETE